MSCLSYVESGPLTAERVETPQTSSVCCHRGACREHRLPVNWSHPRAKDVLQREDAKIRDGGSERGESEMRGGEHKRRRDDG